MPIVSISKIQHRYGLSENLPQLSAAELGWVIDQRRLYIGNGPTAEGAPEIGNTEILTEYSDILSSASTYTYKGEAAGYTVQTGSTPASPVARTLQAKLDDFASVKDFGATGDGSTDDTAAINRALNELFCRDDISQVRRCLYFPAGTYIVSDVIKIPTYAMIKGEGLDCTIIKQTSSSAACVARTADSLQQVGANAGNNGATLPQYIDVIDITFENTTDNDVFLINSSSYMRLHRAGFVGKWTAPTTVGSAVACVKIYSTAVNKCYNIVFEQCELSNQNFGLVADDDVFNLTFNGCKWRNFYKAIKLGENTIGSGASSVGPRSVNISNGYFDHIYSHAIHGYQVSDIMSSFNFYNSVGNHLTSTPSENVIRFENDGCASICDTFARSDANDAIVARIDLGNKKNYYLHPSEGFQNGRRQQRPAISITLTDNTAVATSTGITMSATSRKATKIYYTAERGSYIRHGILTVTASSSGVTISDEFQEDGADIGLEFSATVSGSTTTLKYTTSSTGDDVNFTYGMEHMNYA